VSLDAPGGERRRWLLAWLATFFGFVAVAHGNFETADAAFTMHAAHGLATRGDSGLRRADQGGELPGEQLGAFDIHRSTAAGERRNGKVGANGLAYVWFPVGHVWLLAPWTLAGDALRGAFPAVERAYRERVAPGLSDAQLASYAALSYLEGGPVPMQAPIAMLLPPACAASMLVLLLALARRLGANGRDAAWTALTIVLATQCFALGREQLSDGPGLVLLLAALLAVVAVHQGARSRTAALAGALASGAVVLRYPAVLAVAAFAVAIALACRRRRDWRPLLAFVLGGVPLAALFLATNHARFGDPLETGYPSAGAWFDQGPWNVWKVLLGAGRGVAWLSPLLWVALPLAARRGAVRELRWLAWALLLPLLLLFATAQGWHGGRNWGCRYVTPGVVCFLAVVLPQALPWRRWPFATAALVLLGAFASVTSVVAPVRGVLQLAEQAWQAGGSAGERDDVAGWHPRYTPLVANWRYAAAAARGDLDAAAAGARPGFDASAAVFGVPARSAEQARAPDRWEDRGFRHLWWRFLGALLGVPGWLLVAPVAVLAVALGALAARAGPSGFATAR
jgi:hypothetical protein